MEPSTGKLIKLRGVGEQARRKTVAFFWDPRIYFDEYNSFRTREPRWKINESLGHYRSAPIEISSAPAQTWNRHKRHTFSIATFRF